MLIRSSYAPWALAVFVLSFIAAYFAKDSLFGSTVDSLYAAEFRSSGSFIGSRIDPQVMVIAGDGASPVPLRDIAVRNSMVVIWSNGCDACQELLSHYHAWVSELIESDRSANGTLVYFLARNPGEKPPAGVPTDKVLALVSPASGSAFDGRIVPVVWRVGSEGELVERFYGYDPVQFSRLLEANAAVDALAN